jgi:glycosyltransferase involved in cell wall biosynthesis
MRILWVVTKPPWPARDGGRVVVANTLRALRASGLELLVVAPFDPAREDRDRLLAALREFCEPYLVAATPRRLAPWIERAARGVPITIGRHTLPAVTNEVERVLARRPCSVVHAEQQQALAQCEPARRRSLPIVLRCQNVESELWSALADRSALVRPFASREAARLARYEGRAVSEVAATIALTERDAGRLRLMSSGACAIHTLAAPFPDRMPSATASLPGDPAVVVLASGWFPNRDGVRWFCRTCWPAVRAHYPRAVLHLFGVGPGLPTMPSIVVHDPPLDSREAFPPGAILAVPLRIASGVRIKILEAWARGVPVVATPQAAAGLDARDGEELLVAEDPCGFAGAIGRLHADPAYARASVEAGRALLGERHDPVRMARRLAALYAEVASHVSPR